MTPHHARLAVGVFVLLSAGVAVNILWLQGTYNTKGVRGAMEWPGQRAAADRAKRLAIDPLPDLRDQPPATHTMSASPIVQATPRADARAGQADTAAAETATGELAEITTAIQRELQSRGYQPGAPDGVAGAITRAAIMAWEFDHGLALTGEPTEILKKTIVLGLTPASAALILAQWQALPKDRRARAEQLIKWTQQSLSALGYNIGRVTGRINEDTERAIREFEMDQKLPAGGRISAPLVARIAKLTLPARLGSTR